MDVTPEEFLAHVGVKGMKWGVRKSSPSVTKAKERVPDSEDHKASRQLARQPIRTLSNNQIKAFNERLNLEKSMNQLKAGKSPVKKVDNLVKAALGVAATAGTIYGLVNSPMGKAAIGAGKKALGKTT